MWEGDGVDGRGSWGCGSARAPVSLANGAGTVGLFELAMCGKLAEVPLGALAAFFLLAHGLPHHRPSAARRDHETLRLRAGGV